ncbi:MAG: M48 family metalloprotease [Acidaminococcaceae bacterium]|nr:M48 family metalloprotease [Acidaminococcaceae bacterium]
MLYNLFRDVVVLSLTFIVNFLIVSTFWGLVEMFQPIHWQWLAQLMNYIRVPYTPTNVIIVLSALTLLVPCLLHRTWFMQRYLCWATNCQKPQGEAAERLNQAMSIVCRKAGLDISDYNLYVCNTKVLNAFAIGNNNIAVTLPLLSNMPIREIAGILAHEMGHIQNRDTNTALLTSTMSSFGNFVIRIYSYITLVLQIISFIPVIGWFTAIISWFFLIQIWLFQFLMQLPLHIVTMFSSREDEYEADLYACKIGLGAELFNGLSYISQGEAQMGFAARLLSSHPATRQRLERIRNYVNSHDTVV